MLVKSPCAASTEPFFWASQSSARIPSTYNIKMSPPFLNHSHGFLLLEGLKLTFTLKMFPILLSSLIHYHFLFFLCFNYAESSISSNFSFKRADTFLSVSLPWMQNIWVCSLFYFSILWSAWKMLLFIATAHLCWSLTVPQTRSSSVLFTWSHHNSMASMLSLATFHRWRLRLTKPWKLLKVAELVSDSGNLGKKNPECEFSGTIRDGPSTFVEWVIEQLSVSRVPNELILKFRVAA